MLDRAGSALALFDCGRLISDWCVACVATGVQHAYRRSAADSTAGLGDYMYPRREKPRHWVSSTLSERFSASVLLGLR